MHYFTIDRAKDRPDPRVLLHRTYHLSSLPRLMPLCRLLGHKAVVDGYDSKYGREEERRARWVACDRCGVRPEPQGWLDPGQWNLGQPYTGPFTGKNLPKEAARQLAKRGIVPKPPTEPGPWPTRPEGALNAELVIGRSHTLGAEIKVGNPGSENVLAGHITLGPLGALYVNSERFGQFVQRRFNPSGYQSRTTGFTIHDGRLWWTAWAKRDEWHSSDPRWMQGSVSVDPRDHLWGEQKNHRVDRTEDVPAVVRMPEGDCYDATVRLERWESRRPRGGRSRTYWLAQWDCKEGIPVRNHDWKGDETYSCSWGIKGVTPDMPRWPLILAAKAAEQCSRDRARYGYRAPEVRK